jgi:hypothetical protein
VRKWKRVKGVQKGDGQRWGKGEGLRMGSGESREGIGVGGGLRLRKRGRVKAAEKGKG